MATLHLISTPLTPELIQRLKTVLLDEDVLLFLSQGVYNLFLYPQLIAPYTSYVLESDLKSYGITEQIRHTSCCCIDYLTFVELGIQYERSINWH